MITDIAIHHREPLAGGAIFGSIGGYERIEGTASGALDPAHPANRGIALLDRAPRNAAGLVTYRTDFVLLRPADPALGNGCLLYEVNNRGRIMMIHNLCGGPAGNRWNDAAGLGNAFPFRRGFTLLWSGWDAGAPKTTGLGLETPVIAGLTRRIRDEFVSGTRLGVFETLRLSHDSADSNVLVTARRRRDDLPERVAAELVDARTVRLVKGAPELGTLYEVRYTARDPAVQGVGFAATRDLVSHLRAHVGGVTGRAVERTLAFGISQAGRYLRDHVAGGFNADEAGGRVFDGVFTHVAGIGRVFHNTAFAQPFRTRTWHQDHDFPEVAFPFSAAATTDPITGETGALLRGDASDPLLIETNTPTEYWQKGASLLHTDPDGRRDLALPANVRGYMIAGTQHGGRPGGPRDPGPCRHPRNWHDPSPALRALLVALDEWVAFDRPPPASLLPRIDDGTLTRPEALRLPAVPGLDPPRFANPVAPLPDWTAPLSPTARHTPLVPAVDADGNDLAGIRLPDIAAATGTFLGWNLYAEPYPAGELADRDGTFLAFAATAEAARAAGDPRPSLAERGDLAVARRAAIDALVAARLLLAEDAG
jgi:hypothetical protein